MSFTPIIPGQHNNRIDGRRFFEAFGVLPVDYFEEEVGMLQKNGRLEISNDDLVLLPRTHEEHYALQKFFWDQQYMDSFISHKMT